MMYGGSRVPITYISITDDEKKHPCKNVRGVVEQARLDCLTVVIIANYLSSPCDDDDVSLRSSLAVGLRKR